MNIYQRINKIRKAVQYIRKDAAIQDYRGITHDIVTAKLRDAFIDNGVMVIPSVISCNSTEALTANGKHKIRFEAIYSVEFVNIDEPSDRFSISIPSHADDQGDKAPGKAISYAVKTALLKVCMLETGENDESRVEPERREQKKIDETQVKWIEESIESKGIDKVKFMSFLSKNRIKSIEDITEAFFVDISKMIEKAGEKNVR